MFFFFEKKSSLHSDKSRVTRVSVGRAIHQPTNQSFRVCTVNLATLKVVMSKVGWFPRCHSAIPQQLVSRAVRVVQHLALRTWRDSALRTTPRRHVGCPLRLSVPRACLNMTMRETVFAHEQESVQTRRENSSKQRA